MSPQLSRWEAESLGLFPWAHSMSLFNCKLLALLSGPVASVEPRSSLFLTWVFSMISKLVSSPPGSPIHILSSLPYFHCFNFPKCNSKPVTPLLKKLNGSHCLQGKCQNLYLGIQGPSHLALNNLSRLISCYCPTWIFYSSQTDPLITACLCCHSDYGTLLK